jgi:iron complex outermembrane recepter protein
MKYVKQFIYLMVIVSCSSLNAAVIEEIIVTATKREESLLEVPVAVSVISGVTLDNGSINNLQELTLRMPSVMMSEAQAATNIFIRGVGSGQNYGFEQSVGMFIDGAYFSRSRAYRNPFFDVERVEVLKGPQTVLFGKNVVSGAFNVSSRGPTEEWEKSVTAYYDPEYDGVEFSGIVSGPVSDDVGIRVAARYSDVDGYLKNSLPGAPDPYQREQYQVRGTVQWDITPDFTATLKGELSEYDIKGGYATQPGFLSPAHLALTQANDPNAEANFDYRVSVPSPVGDPLFDNLFNNTNTENVTLTLDWDVGNHQLTSVTSYVAFDFEALTNNDHTNLRVVAGPQRQDSETFSQELRIASTQDQFLEYIAGVYYSDDKYKTRLQATVDLSQSGLGGVLAFDRLGRNQQTSQDGETWAIFGQATLNFTDELRLILGVRYTEDRKTADKRMWYSDASTLDNATVDPIYTAAFNGVLGFEHNLVGVKRKTDDVPFAITGEWDATDDLMVYGYYKEGFKAGGFDEDFTSGVFSEYEFEDEGVKAYAFGAKWSLLGGAAYINAEYFHSEYTNLQVSTFSIASFLVGNAASATSQGLDVDARWQVSDQLGVGAAFVILDAEFDSYTNGPCVLDSAGNAIATFCDLSGQPLQYAPDFEANIYADYTWSVMNGWEMGLGGDLTYSDKFFLAGDLDPDYVQKSYAKVNATLSLTSPDGKYRFSVIGKNLNDEQTSHQKNDIPLANLFGGKGGSAFSDPPRVVAIQAEVNF